MSGAFQGVHLELQSTIDVLDDLQHVAEDVSRRAGLDEEAVHWTSMAVRECVINAITHVKLTRTIRVIAGEDLGLRPGSIVKQYHQCHPALQRRHKVKKGGRALESAPRRLSLA